MAHTGMTWSAFRPSDDEQTYGYLVPSNMFAVVALTYVDKIASGRSGPARPGAFPCLFFCCHTALQRSEALFPLTFPLFAPSSIPRRVGRHGAGRTG